MEHKTMKPWMVAVGALLAVMVLAVVWRACQPPHPLDLRVDMGDAEFDKAWPDWLEDCFEPGKKPCRQVMLRDANGIPIFASFGSPGVLVALDRRGHPERPFVFYAALRVEPSEKCGEFPTALEDFYRTIAGLHARQWDCGEATGKLAEIAALQHKVPVDIADLLPFTEPRLTTGPMNRELSLECKLPRAKGMHETYVRIDVMVKPPSESQPGDMNVDYFWDDANSLVRPRPPIDDEPERGR